MTHNRHLDRPAAKLPLPARSHKPRLPTTICCIGAVMVPNLSINLRLLGGDQCKQSLTSPSDGRPRSRSCSGGGTMKTLATSLLGLFLLFGSWTGIPRAETH